MALPHFWQSALLYTYRPNLINRPFIGVQIISSWFLGENTTLDRIDDKSIWQTTTIEALQNLLHLCPRENNTDSIDENDLVHSYRPILLLRKLFRKQSLKTLKKNVTDAPSQSNIPNNNSEHDVMVLFPQLNLFALISVEFDEESKKIHLKLDDSVSYTLGLAENSTENNELTISYLFGFSSNYWLENVLKPKLQQWMVSALEPPKSDNNSIQGSIRMISVETYCANYNRMKAKYSVPLLDIWSRVEKTDPLKFIFEDIAIAAYLITLWQEERSKLGISEEQKQTFADIGCGNGLLVHILTGEGHVGYGIDVRKRNIWNHYSEDVRACLIEKQIQFDESSISSLPKCDWMIGNHSDELTPWILYMATCASTSTRAFLLPCCPFDFHGNKFQRTIAQNKSQYQCYLDYLQRISEQFGFNSFRDKLRIPSTKRICLVCHSRNYVGVSTHSPLSDEQVSEQIKLLEEQMKEKRNAIVKERIQIASTLRIREKEEVVRNCTQMAKEMKDRIIDRLTNELVNNSVGLTFQEAILLLDSEMKEQMKKQCGGLQTFIRNHRHIFTIVNFRIQFQSIDQLRAKPGQTVKTKECWFHLNHPRGCQLKDDECAFKH